MPEVHLLAPAKVTRSLRVTGVRNDGYHLHRRRDGHRRPRRRALARSGGRPASRSNELAGGLDRRRWTPSNLGGPGAGAGRASAPGCASSSAIPAGAGLGGGSADAAAILRWAGWDGPRRCGPARAPTCPSAWSAAGPGSPASASRSSPWPTWSGPTDPADPAVRLLDAGGVPRLGRPRWASGRTDPTTSSRPPWPWSPAWPSGGSAWPRPPARSRCWPQRLDVVRAGLVPRRRPGRRAHDRSTRLTVHRPVRLTAVWGGRDGAPVREDHPLGCRRRSVGAKDAHGRRSSRRA